jgi:hypothetical protein
MEDELRALMYDYAAGHPDLFKPHTPRREDDDV